MRFRRALGLAQDYLLQGLLFFTSATFGSNPEVRGSLGALGTSSLVTALAAMGASAAAAYWWGRRFDRAVPTGEAEETTGRSPAAQSILTAASVAFGYTAGVLLAERPVAAHLSTASAWCLHVLLLVIGCDLGRQRIWRRIARFGAWCLTLPLAVGLASLAGACVAGVAFGLPAGRALSAGSGFGWYSLAGPMALEAAGAEIAAYVFLTNLLREVITVLVAPLLRGRVGPAVGAALGGATSMDSTLPAMTRTFGPMGTVWGLVTGTTLSLAAPLLLGVFLRLPV